jgi:hypothetical protein
LSSDLGKAMAPPKGQVDLQNILSNETGEKDFSKIT